MHATFFVPQENAPRLKAKLEKLSRKAVRIGCAAIFCTLAKTFSRPHPDATRAAEGERVVYEALTVQGEPPKLAGWVLAATLEHETNKDGEPVNLLRCHGEETLPAKYRTATPDNCDHCHTNRRRNNTYVIRNEATGEWAQVGRTCLKDFLGLHADPGAVARWATLLLTLEASLLSEYDEDEGGYGYSERGYDLEKFLAYTVESIRAEGWASRTYARDHGTLATADMVWYFLTARDEKTRNAYRIPEPTEASYQQAKDAIDWVMAQDASDNDYYHNLQVIVDIGTVTHRTAGYAASIVASATRAKEREVRRAVLVAESNNHVGTVGKRQDMTLTLLGTNTFDGYYGVTTLHRFADRDGNLVVWWASNAWVVPEDTAGHEDCKMVVGATYRVKATIKDHGEYRNQKQTKVARVAVQPLTVVKKTRKRRARKSA